MKYSIDMAVAECKRFGDNYALLVLQPADGRPLPDGIVPGQFVEVLIKGAEHVMLRRPISVCLADYPAGRLWLLVRDAGYGTRVLVHSRPGAIYNMILPLGNGFNCDCDPDSRVLLVGGGVGVAPLLYYAMTLSKGGCRPTILLGARSVADLLLVPHFRKYGDVHVSTEDGSEGQKGLVTANTDFNADYERIACCGPTPMMRAVAAIAHDRGIDCEVSLENLMACGLGACLCCVEDTIDGNLCVCKEGPVFNINRLKWNL